MENCKNVREKICKMSVRNRPNGRDKRTKLSAKKNRQKCPRKSTKCLRKIGKIVREKSAKLSAKNRQNVFEKSAKLSAKNRQKCPQNSLAKIHTNLQIYPWKITRENVHNHKIIVCKIIFESKKCCLLKEIYISSWPSLSDDRLSCLTTPAEYVYISEDPESDLMISK